MQAREVSAEPMPNSGPQPPRDAEKSRALLSVRLSKEFPPPLGKLLEEFELTCHAGEIIALLGTSGSGKTTILNLIAGILPNDDESAPSQSRTTRTESSPNVGLAFQRPELLPWRDCEGNAYHEVEVLGMEGSDVEKRVSDLLRITQLSDYRRLYPDELSVGMQQRLQLVRVLACPRPIMLLDEPLGAVDQPTRLRIAEASRRMLKQSGSACIWVTHDSLEAVTVADTVLVLNGRPLQIVATHHVSRDTEEFNDPARGVKGAEEPNFLSETSLDGQAAALRRHLLNLTLLPESVQPKSSPGDVARSKRSQPWWAISLLPPLTPLLILFVVWEAATLLKPGLRFYVSAPSEWLPLLGEGLRSGSLLAQLRVTLFEAGVGLTFGAPVGIVVGFTAAHSTKISAAIRPTLVGMSAVPLFVLAPAFILWFGIGATMKIAIAALSAFPFIAYMTHDGALDAKGTYYQYLKPQARPARLFATVVVPSTLEGIIESLRPAAVAALIGAFLGEFIAANEGLGFYIILQASRYHVAEVFAGVSLLFFVAMFLDWATRIAARNRHRLVSFWSRVFKKLGEVSHE